MDTYPDIDAWIVRVAKNMTVTQPNITDDLAQEGRIAAWSAWNGKNQPGNVGYAKGAARRRMMQVVMGKRRMLGSENGREKIVVEESVEEIPETPVAPPEYYGHVRAAVRSLPLDERLIVWDRFWCDRTWDKNAGKRWRRTIKPKLEAVL